MKILKKRIIAHAIDVFMLSFGIAGIQFFLAPDLFSNGRAPLLILFMLPLGFRDFVFRNASIGKKIVGICVFDKDFNVPSFKTLFIRGFYGTTVEYLMFSKAMHLDGEYISLFDWERDKIGTFVIDKKVFAELSEIAKKQEGNYSKNMRDLYNEYIRHTYLKSK